MSVGFRIERFERNNWLGLRRWYFRLKIRRNGEIVAPSEAYNAKRDRDHMAQLLKDSLEDCDIVDVPR